MARIPEYGTHDGIKYSPRRTIIRWCIICNNPFIPTGKRDKVCSDECRLMKERRRSLINTPKYNIGKVHQPPKTEEERRARINYWKKWYANLSPEQRQKYNHKKKKGATKQEDTYDSIQAELKALGLR